MRAGLVAAVLLIGCGGGASAPDAAHAPDGARTPDAASVPDSVPIDAAFGAAIDIGGDEDPSVLVADDGTLVVAYYDDVSGNADLYLRTSTDGVTWAAPTQITSTTDNDYYPTLVEVNGHYDLSWFRIDAGGDASVWFATTDDLATWPAGVAVTSGSPLTDWVPTLAATPTGLEIVFVSNRRGTTGRWELYGTTSSDGAAWSTPTELSVNDNTVQDHLPALLGGDPMVLAWTRCGDSNPMYCGSADAELYTATSSDGATWSTPSRVTNDSNTDIFVDAYVRGGAPALAWVTTATSPAGTSVTMPIGGSAPTALPFDGYSPRVALTHTPNVYLGAWTGTGTSDANDVYVRLFGQ